jgi:SsrA-binding protein
MAKPAKTGEQLIVKNRRATFDYEVHDTFEGGLSLLGSEVKSMRAGKVDLVDAYAVVEGGQLWLKQLYIAPFEQASAFPHEPRRARRVLVHRHEIEQIASGTSREGLTCVPMRLYFKGGRVKVELALAKGKKKVDKRLDIAKKDAQREARAELGRRQKGG